MSAAFITPPCALPIVQKLLAVESASPDFLGGNDGGCHTCYHRNPDGPEAAALIADLVAALKQVCTYVREAIDDGALDAIVALDAIDAVSCAALAKARGKRELGTTFQQDPRIHAADGECVCGAKSCPQCGSQARGEQ